MGEREREGGEGTLAAGQSAGELSALEFNLVPESDDRAAGTPCRCPPRVTPPA